MKTLKQIRKTLAALVAATFLLTSLAASAATPIVLYKMDQAASGTTPTSLTDTASGTAIPLTITYGAGSWTSITAGDGLTFTSTSCATSGSLAGTKATSFAGATQATIEVVVDTTNETGFNDVLGFQASSFDDLFTIVTGSAGAGTPQIGVAGPGGVAAWFDVTKGLHHLMAVMDNTQVTPANRLLLYVDTVLATVDNAPFTATYPALNAAIDVGNTNYANNRISMGCLTSAGAQSLVGPVYFGAMYATALTSGDDSAHYSALIANNDADPNTPAGLLYSGLSFTFWELIQ